MVNPAVARCGHSFCRLCIKAYLDYPHKRPRRLEQPPHFVQQRQTLPQQQVNLVSTVKFCPVCKVPLPDSVVFPNTTLAALVEPTRRAASASAPVASSPIDGSTRLEQLHDGNHTAGADHLSAVSFKKGVDVDVDALSDSDADVLLTRLLARRNAKTDAQRALRTALALPFLERCCQDAATLRHRLSGDLQLMSDDLRKLRTEYDIRDPSRNMIPSIEADLKRRALVISKYHDNIKAMYLKCRRNRDHNALDAVMDTLVDATSVSSLSRRATIHHIDILRVNPNLVTSVQFNASASLFATAGVTRRIKVYDFASIIDDNADDGPPSQHHCPILNFQATSKLASLSWSFESAALLAAATYKGDIIMHDTEKNTQVLSLREHERRTLFIDFSHLKPNLLLSGSDDRTVKLWDVRAASSSMTLQTSANVCCVRFNPAESNEFAFGSANHNVYSYDLRHPAAPLCVFEGHYRAVSHIVFLNRSQLVSASTDSSCKIWDVVKQEPGLSYTGHANERNFVGLCASNEFFACGSEDNGVYVYHKGFSGPVVRCGFGSGGGFVSTVAWKPNSPWLVAATNNGNLEVLELQ